VKFIADEVTNSIIVTTYPRLWQEIEGTIKLLDRMPRQVLIEVLVAEITLSDDTRLGIDWAVRTYSAARAKVIFVAGSPFDAMKPYQRRFWFDQGGQLTAKFGIRHTPAVVTGAAVSSGVKALKVSEVPLAPKGRAS